jgi:hypothetical protein
VSGSIIQGKRYPESQRTIVLQFGSPEEAAAWEEAGCPFTLAWPPVASGAAAIPEDEQHQRHDGEDDQDRPKHEATLPLKRRGKPRIRIGGP